MCGYQNQVYLVRGAYIVIQSRRCCRKGDTAEGAEKGRSERLIEAGGGGVFEDQFFVHVEHLLAIKMNCAENRRQ